MSAEGRRRGRDASRPVSVRPMKHSPPAPPLTLGQVLEDGLAHGLGPAVARLGRDRRRLGDRNRPGDAVDGGRRRIDDVLGVVSAHDLAVGKVDVKGGMPKQEGMPRTSSRLMVAETLFW